MEHAKMTPIGRLLRQGIRLRVSATQNTGDVNEAYWVVHQVMIEAIGRANEDDGDLHPALTRALVNRSQRLAKAEAAI